LQDLRASAALVQTTTAIGLRRDLAALRAAGLTIVRMLHFPAQAMVETRPQRWSKLEVSLLNRLVAKNIVLSDEDRRALAATFGIPTDSVLVVPQGHDLEQLVPSLTPEQARSAVGLKPERRAVGLVGRLTPQKGHRYLIEAAHRIRDRASDVQFVLVGAGELETELRAQVAELGLSEAFVFAGFQRDVRTWIQAADVMVMPSLFESAPLVLLECMALRRPTVLSDIPSFRAYADESCAKFVRPRDPASLADAVAQLLAEPDAAMTLAARGETMVRTRFGAKVHVAAIASALDLATSRR